MQLCMVLNRHKNKRGNVVDVAPFISWFDKQALLLIVIIQSSAFVIIYQQQRVCIRSSEYYLL